LARNKQLEEQNKTRRCIDYFKICYKEVGKKLKYFYGSLLGNLLFFLATVFSLFNFDVKILATDSSADPAFSITMNVVFFILFSEFMVALLFEQNYFGSFYFYLDLIDVLSLIPDTEMIMKIFSRQPGPGQEIGAEHLIEASSYSQTAAK
jgi:hypothetical protein